MNLISPLNFIYQKLGIEVEYQKWEIEEHNLKSHLETINDEDFIGAKISSISTSPEREDTILLENPFK